MDRGSLHTSAIATRLIGLCTETAIGEIVRDQGKIWPEAIRCHAHNLHLWVFGGNLQI